MAVPLTTFIAFAFNPIDRISDNNGRNKEIPNEIRFKNT